MRDATTTKRILAKRPVMVERVRALPGHRVEGLGVGVSQSRVTRSNSTRGQSAAVRVINTCPCKPGHRQRGLRAMLNTLPSIRQWVVVLEHRDRLTAALCRDYIDNGCSEDEAEVNHGNES